MSSSKREIITSRIFDAPPEKLFAAFLDPIRLARWWGPNGFTNTIDLFEPKKGGSWNLTMHGPDGTDYANEWQFEEITFPQRIVLLHLRPMHRFQLAMTFESLGPSTRLTWCMLFDSAEEVEAIRPFVEPANEQNFDRLQAELNGETV